MPYIPKDERPIVHDEMIECGGKCGRRVTPHRVLYFKDQDSKTCLVCGNHKVVYYKKDTEEEHKTWTEEQIEPIRQDIYGVAIDLESHKWGKVGKKDLSFLERVARRLRGIGDDLIG